jgi:hypothetical protein
MFDMREIIKMANQITSYSKNQKVYLKSIIKQYAHEFNG